MADSSNFSLDSGSDRPLAWALIPVLVILAIGLCAAFWKIRRRRARRRLQQQEWPSDPEQQIGRHRSGQPWNSTRPREGLNELGQAPPPYQVKTSTDDEDEEGTELRDMVAGARPPAYPEEPEPAVTTDTRRTT